MAVKKGLSTAIKLECNLPLPALCTDCVAVPGPALYLWTYAISARKRKPKAWSFWGVLGHRVTPNTMSATIASTSRREHWRAARNKNTQREASSLLNKKGGILELLSTFLGPTGDDDESCRNVRNFWIAMILAAFTNCCSFHQLLPPPLSIL